MRPEFYNEDEHTLSYIATCMKLLVNIPQNSTLNKKKNIYILYIFCRSFFFYNVLTQQMLCGCIWWKYFAVHSIHKWNSDGCQHWQDVNNSWQKKKSTRQMCHLLVFKYGSLNNNCGTLPRHQQPKESFSLLYFGAPRPLYPLWECVDGMHIHKVSA